MGITRHLKCMVIFLLLHYVAAAFIIHREYNIDTMIYVQIVLVNFVKPFDYLLYKTDDSIGSPLYSLKYDSTTI